MKTLFIEILFIQTLFFGYFDPTSAFKTATVEYKYGLEQEKSLSIQEIMKLHVAEYEKLINNISETHNNTDIIVFPECTLDEFLGINDIQKALDYSATIVPSAKEKITPCDQANMVTKSYSDALISLSCAAKNRSVYLVVNLHEKENCTGQKECASYGFNVYNTNVVFNRNGTVVARYRKFHPFGEKGTNITNTSDLTTFETDFGVTFGTFVCFDILYESPPLDLVKKGVKNFIFSTMWFSELPYLTALQTQQMWSHANDVIFVSSGAVNAKEASGGSGVFMGSQNSLVQNIVTLQNHSYLYSDTSEIAVPVKDIVVNSENARKMDGFKLLQEDLSEFKYQKLTSKNKIVTICDGKKESQICCNFNVEFDQLATKNATKNQYIYQYLVKSGQRSFSGKYLGGQEICSIVACQNEDVTSCGKRFPNYDDVEWPIIFKKIEISANFTDVERKKQFPNSVLADITPIPPQLTVWDAKNYTNLKIVERTFATNNVSINQLLTFAIYGRNFALDGPVIVNGSMSTFNIVPYFSILCLSILFCLRHI